MALLRTSHIIFSNLLIDKEMRIRIIFLILILMTNIYQYNFSLAVARKCIIWWHGKDAESKKDLDSYPANETRSYET